MREVTSPQAERLKSSFLCGQAVVTQRQSATVQTQVFERRQTDEGVVSDVHERVVGDVEDAQRRRDGRHAAERRHPVEAGVERLERRQRVEQAVDGRDLLVEGDVETVQLGE